MTDKSTFSADEWNILRDTPQLVALAIASSGASGVFGTVKEAFSSSTSLIEGMKSENPLLRGLSSREEVTASQQSLRDVAKELKGSDFKQVQQRIATRALDSLRAALDVLERKGSAGDYDAYAGFVKVLAKRVAEAAKEGSFLGFGGERVSEGERQLLAKLDGTLSRSARA